MQVIGIQNDMPQMVDLVAECREQFNTSFETEAIQKVIRISEATSKIVFRAMSLDGDPDAVGKAIAICEELKQGIICSDDTFVYIGGDEAVDIFRRNLDDETRDNMDSLQEHFL